jgi:hypothetical protein
MELWRGLISNHDFLVQRSDTRNDRTISFDNEQYLSYVPIRRSWTVCVDDKDQIPPGSAGVLLNQTHLFPDLFVVVKEREKQIFEAIDGRRSISEIVETVEGASPLARDFFRKLWWNDQIVFDTAK